MNSDYIDVCCRIISRSDGKFSFQIFNNTNNEVLFSAPTWWDSEAEAIKASEALKTSTETALREKGIDFITPNSTETAFDMTKVSDMKDMPTVHDLLSKGGNPVVTDDDKIKLSALDICIVQDKDTNKFSIIVKANDQIVRGPTAWYDTVEEAYTVFNESVETIVKEIEGAGGSVSVNRRAVKDPSGMDIEQKIKDLQKQLGFKVTDGYESPTVAQPEQPNNKPSTKPPFNPFKAIPGFDASSN